MLDKVYTTNQGYEIVIIEYKNNRDCTIKFLYNDFTRNAAYNNIQKGTVRNPYHKSCFGVGFLGIGNYKSRENKKTNKYYSVWKSMFERCYDESRQEIFPTYKGCSVDERWHNFQNFAEWFDKNYIDGFHLDKDILIKGNKVYSPETCCFVPVEINSLFTKTNALRGSTAIGVTKDGNKFRATCGCGTNNPYLGIFDTEIEAFEVYKKAKEKCIKEVAKKWKNKIDIKVYNVLINYQVEITD